MNGHVHEEDHSRGPVCGSGDPGGPARRLLDGALECGGKWTVRLPEPATAGEVAGRVAVGLAAVAQRLAVDGVVAGHVTAQIRCGAGSAALSVTRLGTVDGACGVGWQPDGLVRRCDVAVTVVSLLDSRAVTQAVLDGLFGGEGEGKA